MEMVRSKSEMGLDVRIFESISPSRFISFTIPNPVSPLHLLRIAVLDLPVHSIESSPRVAVTLVPKHRETDWIFSTESGHLQLLLNLPDISRLILIGDDPEGGSDVPAVDNCSEGLELRLKPLVVALSPKTLTGEEIDDVPFLIYEDNVVSSVELEKSVGPFVGEMLIEDVEIEIDGATREFRRRLRFKRMPNLVQSDIKIIPTSSSSGSKSSSALTRTELFKPHLTELVHPYLAPMVASLSLIGSSPMRSRRKALCIGVGGGGLLSFLRLQLGFEVTGVEIDPEVLRVARQYFGLEESYARVHVEDGIEFLKKFSSTCDDESTKFDVLMVDLDSTNPIHGVSAPPIEFVARDVLLAARSALLPCGGIFVINVIPPNRTFYKQLKDELKRIFVELYEIDVGNGENFVLIATNSSRDHNKNGGNLQTPAVLMKYIDAIERI